MMTLEYLKDVLKAENFTRDGDTLVSVDQRVKIALYPEGGFGSYYDGVWWESAEYEDHDDLVADLTWYVVDAFGHPTH